MIAAPLDRLATFKRIVVKKTATLQPYNELVDDFTSPCQRGVEEAQTIFDDGEGVVYYATYYFRWNPNITYEKIFYEDGFTWQIKSIIPTGRRDLLTVKAKRIENNDLTNGI